MKLSTAVVSVLSLLVSSGFSATEDECFGLMINLARDAVLDKCPIGEDPSVNCALDCFKDYVNMLYMLDIAECPDDMFACHKKPIGEQCEEIGTVCHSGSGDCFKTCSSDEDCDSADSGEDSGYTCMSGYCAEHESQLVQMTLGQKAGLIAAFCGTHGDSGEYCLDVVFGSIYALYNPGADECAIKDSWGCCGGSVEQAMPQVDLSEVCPENSSEPACEVGWVVQEPELDESKFDYMEEFCGVCQESTFHEDCASIAPVLCGSPRVADFSHCSESAGAACELYEKTGAPGQQTKCFEAMQASAAEVCKKGPDDDSVDPEPEPSDSSDDDEISCRRCSPKEMMKEKEMMKDRRRHLNFGGVLPCCRKRKMDLFY